MLKSISNFRAKYATVYSQTNPHISFVGQNNNHICIVLKTNCASLGYLWAQHAFSEELNNKKSAELPKMRHLCLMGGERAGLMKALIFVMPSVNENE